MSETTERSKKPSLQEAWLQLVLCGTTIPLRESGGIVFPNGFPGIGYHLPEWRFERYRAGLETCILGPEGKRRSIVSMLLIWFAIVAITFICFTYGSFGVDDLLAGNSSAWLPIAAIAAVAVATFTILQLMQNSAMRFAEPFDDVPRVGRFRFLNERALRVLASGLVKPQAPHIRTLYYLLIVVGCYVLSLRGLGPNLLLWILILVCSLLLVRQLQLVFIYWHFRLRNGRPPGPQDLKPLSLSAS